MADNARKKTDKLLEEMEKEVEQIYSRASKEISEKWEKYMDSHKEKVESAYGDLRQALASGDSEAIKEARANYERVVKNVTLNNDRYNAMVKETSAKLSHVNEVASDYVNGNMAQIYTLNYNQFANEDIDGYTFTLVNEQAVKNLAKEDKSLLPAKKIDIPKDMAWNTKNINSEVLQGILQGENIPKIADRLMHVTDMNKNSSVRNARTMVTSAENKGRQDSFKKAESDGVIMKRRWVATNDDRTRAWHADLDGVEVDLDEPWENEYGEIMYPGDPSADPANVYNCRCSIRAIVAGFKWNYEEPEEEQEQVQETDDVQYMIDDIQDIIMNGEGFQDVPEDLRIAIADSLNGIDNKKVLEEITTAMKDFKVVYHDTSGTSKHRYGTNAIEFYSEKSSGSERGQEGAVRTFWHEFGHYVDDTPSGTSYGYDAGGYFVHGITGVVDEDHQYADAACKDVNAFLERYGLSDRFEMRRDDEWSSQWLYYKGTDEGFDLSTASFEDSDALHSALNDWMNEQSGYNDAVNFLYDMGYPRDVQYTDYMTSYRTPKRQELKWKEKYKGAEDDFYEESRRISELRAEFRERSDWEELVEKQHQMYTEANLKKDALGWVTDTFDGASYGSFCSVISGGHTADYYKYNNNNIREGVANVFMAEVKRDQVVQDGMKDLCPNMYNLMKGVIKDE